MKRRIKGKVCLNCNTLLTDKDNYCPECGQENNTTQLSFGQLVKDFFANYVSLDSRFGRSFIPFLIKPGFLTKAFIEGKRNSFANPIRWYLVISLIHFFVVSQVTKNFTEDGERIFRTSQTNNPRISISTPNDTLNIVEDVNEEDVDSLNNDSDLITAEQLAIIEYMANDNASKKEIFDSLQVDSLTFGNRLFVKQTVKLALDDQLTLNTYIVQNIPILIFIFLPIYALLLKLFYRKKLYINHLIHSIYIHSLLLFGLIFYWIAFLLFNNEPPPLFNIAFFGLIAFHSFLSFKNLYETKIFRALWTLLLSGFLYTILLLIGFLILVLFSLILF